MFTSILVAVDGRQGGRDAIALAQVLASSEGTITLAHVYGDQWMLGRGAGVELEYERIEAEQLLERERALARLDSKTVVVGERPVGRGLHELVERLRSDLLVLGSTRHALLGRVLIGDDCRAASIGAPCAVAVAPRGYAQMSAAPKTVGVGYDGSPESRNALAAARELSAIYGARLEALSVVSLQAVRDEKPIPADWPGEAEALTSRRAEELERLDGVEGQATYGGTCEELTRFGNGLDLLIVGSRGYGPLGRLIHGSVSSYLVSHATCALVVLPRGRSVPETDGVGDTAHGRLPVGTA